MPSTTPCDIEVRRIANMPGMIVIKISLIPEGDQIEPMDLVTTIPEDIVLHKKKFEKAINQIVSQTIGKKAVVL
jgi:hypothetical protein